MEVRFHAAARQELRDAVRYYNVQRAGLGNEFGEAIKAGIERIRLNPEAWQPLSANTRRHVLHQFPYGIVYQIRRDMIPIVAVAHLHREPDYWQSRAN